MARISTYTNTGLLIGDQRRDQLLLAVDFDGDGIAASAGELSVFFDADNGSGLELPTNNVFTVHQAPDGAVYYGDGSADSVFRLMDLNNDGDAQDAGEAGAWFTADNASGFSTVTPNGIATGGDGAIYIANAGTGSAPQDAIYRTVDLNDDGDADDEGESTLWLDVQTLIETAVPFDLTFVGDVAYLNDLTGTADDVIWRLEDLNGDGSIGEGEAKPFISDAMNFGAPVDISSSAGPEGELYALSWFPSLADGEVPRLYRLTDLNGSDDIDDAQEAVEVWNDSALPEGFEMFVGFSVVAHGDGRVSLTSDGNVLTLTDLNDDGDFFDDGETQVVASETYIDPLDRPRAVEVYTDETPVTRMEFTTVGAGNHFSIFLDQQTNTLFSTGENVVGQLGNGSLGFDVKTPLEVLLPEGFGEVIVSISAGLLHSTFLTNTGDVYAFGFNNRGPLGLGDEETRTEAVKIASLDETDVISIANGNSFSFAIDDNGNLYGWGSNTNGQLGLGDRDERLEPVQIDFFADKPVVAVAPGNSHTLVLTAAGEVYAMGAARDGQLGSSEALDEDGTPLTRVETPLLVEGLEGEVIAISTFTKTSFAVTSDGRVFGWGESRNGQLLVGEDEGDGTFVPDPSDVLLPIELTDLLPAGVIDVQGGARWAVALTEDGDVYAWGPNDEGPTGGLDGDPGIESDVTFYPTKIAELDDVNVVEITTGPNSIIAVTDTGQIFTWGSNSDGRLGFESEGSVYTPQQIVLGDDAGPFLVSATPADNARDVFDNTDIVLRFTEAVMPGEGAISLVNRDTGARTEIDVTSDAVSFDGAVVTIDPAARLELDTRYAVEISDGAFLDLEGNGWSGIDEGDTSTFNFTTSEIAGGEKIAGGAGSEALEGTIGGDTFLLRFGTDEATGNGGADIFVIDSRYVNEGDVHTVADFDAGEGDKVLFRFFDERREISSDEDLDFYVDNGFATVLADIDGKKTISFQNLDQNFGSADQTFIGTRADDAFDGGDGADSFLIRFGDDSVTGGTGADSFIFDGRYVGTGSEHVVNDLSFDDGDTLLLRFFDGSPITIASQEDLSALSDQSFAEVASTEGSTQLILTNGDGDSMEITLFQTAFG